MTDDEWQALHENFETQWLLDAIDDVDTLRSHLSENQRDQPPVRRDKQDVRWTQNFGQEDKPGSP